MVSDGTTKREGSGGREKTGPGRGPGDDPYGAIRTLLTSADAGDLRKGLELAEREIARVGSSEARPLFEIVSAVFYLDPLDRPDLMPVLDEAVNLVVGFGEWVIPVLVDHLEAGDVKAQLAVGHVQALDPVLHREIPRIEEAVRQGDGWRGNPCLPRSGPRGKLREIAEQVHHGGIRCDTEQQHQSDNPAWNGGTGVTRHHCDRTRLEVPVHVQGRAEGATGRPQCRR